jgi:cell division protein ZapA (FtsZ GTPase activity inhibitor)
LDQHITIEIFGHPFTFRADKNISKAKEVAAYLEEEVGKVERKLSAESVTINKRAILILTALNIANEYFELKDNQAVLLDTMSQKTTGILDSLNTVAL